MTDTITPEIIATAPWIGDITDAPDYEPPEHGWYWVTEYNGYAIMWRISPHNEMVSVEPSGDFVRLKHATECIRREISKLPYAGKRGSQVIAIFREWAIDSGYRFEPRAVAKQELQQCPECRGTGRVTLFFSVEACSLGCQS